MNVEIYRSVGFGWRIKPSFLSWGNTAPLPITWRVRDSLVITADPEREERVRNW